jgi:hypothetical protein
MPPGRGRERGRIAVCLPILPRSKERRAFQRGHDATKRPRSAHAGAGVLDGLGCSMGWGARCAGVLDGLGCSMGWGARCAGVLGAPGCSVRRGARCAGVLDGPGCSMGRGARWAGVLDGPGCSMGRGARWAGVLGAPGCSMGKNSLPECEKLPVQRSIARVKRPLRPCPLVRSLSKTDLPVQQPVQ